MKTKIKIDFIKFTDSDLETRASFILQSMTGNANFPSPVPPLADLQTLLGNYSIALVNAKEGGRLKVAEKNQYRRQLENLLNQLGLYVMSVANGNDVLLASSGYNIAKQPEPVQIANPGVVTLSNGVTSGELKAEVKTVYGAKSYLHQITPDPLTPQSQWESTTSSRSKMLYTNLQPGIRYWVRVGAVGANRQIAYGPQNSKFVQ